MKNRYLLLSLALSLLTGLALAGQVEQHYAGVRNKTSGVNNLNVIASHRNVVDGSEDSKTIVTLYDSQDTGGDTTVVVAPRFTAAGATCTCEVWLYQTVNGTNTFMGIADVQTATAGAGSEGFTDGTYYLPLRPLYFDTAGADRYDVRYTALSTGTVYSWAWTTGSFGKAAD
jgi:hypothetical protein